MSDKIIDFPVAPNGLLIFMKADDTSKFTGSVKVNFNNLDASHSVRLLNRPKFPTVNPVDLTSGAGGGGFGGGAPELYSTDIRLFVDKSIINSIMHCFGGTNLGTFTIWEVGADGNGPAILTTRKLYNVFITALQFDFDVNYELLTSEGMILKLLLTYPKIDEIRTQYGADMGATGNIGSSSDREKDAYQPTS